MQKRWWRTLGRCHRHVPRDFINSFIALEWLVRSVPERCHSNQFNNRNIAKSIASHPVPPATCHWHVERVWNLLLLWSNGLKDSDRTDFVRPGPATAILCGQLHCVLCHVARAYGTCTSFTDFAHCSRTADPIWTEPTMSDTGKR